MQTELDLKNENPILNNDVEDEDELTNLTDYKIYSILLDLDKACTVLVKLLDDYIFDDDEHPDIQSLKEWFMGNSQNAQASNSEKWIREYNTISQFIDITYDYVNAARHELEEIFFDYSLEEEEIEE
jgi:hypothetical protein